MAIPEEEGGGNLLCAEPSEPSLGSAVLKASFLGGKVSLKATMKSREERKQQVIF